MNANTRNAYGYPELDELRRALHPSWYRTIRWEAVAGWTAALVVGTAIWSFLIYGAVEGWKHVGR